MKIGRLFSEAHMTYRGIVANGVVVLEGDKPDDGTIVEVSPVAASQPQLAELPAFGLWRPWSGTMPACDGVGSDRVTE